MKFYDVRAPTTVVAVPMQAKPDPLSAPLAEALWTRVSACFNTDDGSLPDILIENLEASEVKGVYGMIRRLSRLPAEPRSLLWSTRLGAEVPIESLPDAAEWVVTGEAEPFHHCVQDLSLEGVVLPEIGVFVLPQALNLDYRMGPEWDSIKVAGLFQLLERVRALAPSARIGPSELMPASERFRSALAWHKGLRESG
jgi:hypothetical protein